MSTTIDSKVVEMRFDNSNFEKNIATSMSTLDKLKQRLNLTGASKSLENLDSTARKVNLSGLGGAVETVHAKFSALEVMGVTALANITNQAVNTGKRMLSALTIDPIKTGLQEYETQMNAVQTILANTQSKGSTLDDVNKALDTLNTYADKTIYNFTEMTRNIGTFTAAGVDLQTSVDSIQGIANLAAVSGSSSQQASTAMYQLSQALAAGKVSLMDWNSVVNAGMGGELFQNALIRTSELLKTGAKESINTYGSFRESLTKGQWLTTEVLTETLKQLSGAYSEADLIAQGFTKEQAKEITSLAETATNAATKVKTFSQLWDVMKESAQSGWSQTWKLIIGDFEEAKSLLTPLADTFTGIINRISEARNTFLSGVLKISDPWATITGKLDKAGLGKIKEVADTVGKVTDKLEHFQDVVNKVWKGDYKNSDTGRFELLEKAGYDHRVVQDLVNKGRDYKLTVEDIEESHKKFGLTLDKNSEATKKVTSSFESLSDEKLRDAGLTETEINLYRDLEKEAARTGVTVSELVDEMSKNDGRTLLIESFKNAWSGIVGIFTAVKNAWSEMFPAPSVIRVYNVIKAINEFSEKLRLTDAKTGKLTETGEKLQRTFRGIFAIASIVADIFGGGLRIAFKAVSSILSYFDLNILDVTAAIGDALVKFREMTDVTKLFDIAIANIVPILSDIIKSVREWANAFLDIPQVQEIIDKLTEGFKDLKNLDFKEIGQYIIEGLKNGIGDGASDVVKKIIELGKDILIGICEVLGIHSPSVEFFEIGTNIIQGLLNGLKDGISGVLTFFKDLGTKCIEAIGNIDWSTIFAGGVSVAILLFIKKIADAFETLVSPLEGLGDLFAGAGKVMDKSAKGIGKVLKSFSKVLNSFAFSINAKAFKNVAISFALVIGSVILLAYMINKMDDNMVKDLWHAVGIVTVLAVILAGLAFAVSALSKSSVSLSKDGASIQNFGAGLLGIAASLALVAVAVKLMGSMEAEQWKQGLLGLAAAIGAIGVVLAAYFAISAKSKKGVKHIDKLGSMLVKMAVSMLLMVGVIKLIGMLKAGELIKGGIAMAAFVVFVKYLSSVTETAGPNVSALGGMLIKLSISMLLLVGVIKLIGMLRADELIKGGIAMGAFVVFVGLLVKACNQTEYELPKLGGILISLSISMLLLVGVIKLIGMLKAGELIKGGIAIGAFLIFVKSLTKILNETKSDIPKLAGTLIAMSVAIGILAGVCILLSLISIEGLAKGLIAVGILGSIMALMITATKEANDVKGSIIAMAIAIGVMVAAVALLSLIDWTKLAPATIALGTLMGMFALIAKAAGTMQNAMGSLIVMTVVVGLLAGLVYMIAKLPIELTIGAAAALSILMLSMGATMKMIGSIGPIAMSGIGALALMGLVVAELALILGLMAHFNVVPSIETAASLSLLLTAMSGALVILGVVGLMGPAAFIGIGALATLIAGIGGLIITIGALVTEFPKLEEFLNNGLPVLEKIGYAIGSFFGNIIGGFIDSAILDTFPKLGASLSAFMTNAMPFVTGVKMVDVSMLEGVGVLTAAIIALTAADFINGIVSFISGGSSFADLGTQLSAFMTNASSFVAGVRTIDPAVAEGAKSLAEMILILTAADVLSGMTSWLTGGTSLADFGTQLVPFGTAMAAFSAEVSGKIDEGAVVAAANAGKVMAEMQTSIYGTGGVIQWFCGEKDFAAFGVQLVAFGKAIAEFSKTVSAEGAINETAIMAAANAGKMMTEFQTNIVGTGGVIQWFCGEKDMATFGMQLVAFGRAIVDFSKIVSAEGAINEEAITAAANAGSLMASLQTSLEPMNGVWQAITGEKDFTTFGIQLMNFARALVNFSKIITEGNISEEAITAAANAGRIMAQVQSAIPEDKWLDGKISIDDFGKKIAKFGKGLVAYSDEVVNVDSGAVASSLSSARKLVSIAKSVIDLDTSGIDAFKNVKSIGSTLKGYYNNIEEVDQAAISSSISSANRLASFIRGLAGLDASGVSTFKTAISSLGSVDIEGAMNAFKASTANFKSVGSGIGDAIVTGLKSKQASLMVTATQIVTAMINVIKSKNSTFKVAGTTSMLQFVAGINSQKGTIANAARSAVSAAVSGIKSYYSQFHSAGGYLAKGLANGISENAYLATAKASAMAKAAATAAKKALGIHSPSKVFYGLGKFSVLGFVNALGDYGRKVYNTSADMANLAKNGFGDAVYKIKDAIENGIDTQPTIRPVIDLSNVSAGAGAINGMFNMNPSVGVMSNVRSISSMMNNRQNGMNDDVVSAIDKLRKELGNIGGNTYNNINGITYDDGSNINNAVKTLIRAAKVEGRI